MYGQNLSEMSLEQLEEQFLDETDPTDEPREIDYWYVDRLLDFAIRQGILELHIIKGTE